MHPFTKILFVMDGDMDSMVALQHVIALSRQHQASVTLFDVVETLPRNARMLISAAATADLRNGIVGRKQDQLQALVSMIGHDEGGLHARVRFGKRPAEIAREAADGRYDLVIKIPERGRTDRYLARNCNCPVWLLEPGDHATSDRIFTSLVPRLSPQKNRQPAPVKIGPGSRSFAS